MKKIFILIFILMSTTAFAAFWNKEKKIVPAEKTLISFVDGMIGISYSFSPAESNDLEEYLKNTVRPFIGLGCRPFVFLPKKIPILDGLGFGFQTKIFSIGIHMYYSHPNMKPFFLAFDLGWDWKGNTLPGASLGTRF